MLKSEISVVVPLYNEEGNAKELHRRIVDALNKLNRSYEIIFVNDGSTDGTLQEAKQLSPVVLVNFRKNFGQTAAFDAGIKVSNGNIVVTMDGDLQNDPKDIGLLLEKIDQGFDCVAGWRWQRKDDFTKKFFSRGANLLRKFFLADSIHDSGIGLKAYRREALEGLDLFGEMHRFIPGLLELDGFRVTEVKVSHHPRIHGQTKYNWKRAFKGFSDMVYIWFLRKFANRPMHFFGASGIVLCLLGTVVLVWMVIEKIALGTAISERIWPMVGFFFVFIGVQFFIFGLLADLSLKNYYKVRNRMNYTIKEIIRTEK
ncbi:MAG: glycosyltransferase family 2 protein [Candidatus Moranbacteria bacterium]|nr:glycosyltransferase family 2 protein [Candidatus Moranbacteria bacterium]